MKRVILPLILAFVLFLPHPASAVTKYRAQHYRWANGVWCPQNWRTAYGAKRLIRCEARLYGVSVSTATYVAHRESRFHWWASNSCCHGLFQQHEAYWGGRFRTYAPRHFHHSIFSGRTNAVVSIRMARVKGWCQDWGVC